ncbi:MAG: hypothetical protein ACFFD4_17355 [Candidatus Odinarchaeota archaeon]
MINTGFHCDLLCSSSKELAKRVADQPAVLYNVVKIRITGLRRTCAVHYPLL